MGVPDFLKVMDNIYVFLKIKTGENSRDQLDLQLVSKSKFSITIVRNYKKT